MGINEVTAAPPKHRTPSRPHAVRIASVALHGFRGIPGDLEVSFARAGGRPSSAIVFGDNGSGKSSIVDAVEWACQGRVGRSAKLRGAGMPSIINLAARLPTCAVEVTLDDGHIVRRRAGIDDEGNWWSNGDPIPDAFRRVPMSLKRADILRFLETAPVQRGALFLDHALGDQKTSALTRPFTAEQTALEEERHEAKRQMREAAARLADLLGVDPPPRDANDIEQMIAIDVYKGVPLNARFRISVPREIQERVDEVQKIRRRIKELNQAAKRLRRRLGVPSSGMAERLQAMQTLLGDVGDWLTDAFLAVTKARHVERVQPVFGRLSEVSLEIDVRLTSGATATPQQVFSEGYQDLIALLYFLAVARAAGEQGQARVLILDDVLQSVDATIRVAVMELLVRDFKDWQLLMTVHDRLWRTQLKDIFRRAGHPIVEVEIRRWDFDNGPHVVAAGNEPDAALRAALDSGDPSTVCSAAGRLLEQICDRLSWTIPFSVKRKHGDLYTVGDLWPGTMKALKRTSCAPALLPIDRWLHLRNTVGAHYNEWAEGLTWAEAEAFGYAVLDLLYRVRCDRCQQWIERQETTTYSCRCEAVRVQPT